MFGERLLAVDVQVVDHQVDGTCEPILAGDIGEYFCKLGTGAARSGKGKVPPRARLDGAEHVARAFAFVFAIAFGDDSRPSLLWRPHFAMERNWFFVQANHGFLRIMGPFVEFQHVFHARQIGGVDLWQTPHFFPATA